MSKDQFKHLVERFDAKINAVEAPCSMENER